MWKNEKSQGACYTAPFCHAIISACTVSEDYGKVLNLYGKMHQGNDIRAEKETLLCVIKACHSTKSFYHGRQVHNQIVEDSRETDTVLGNSLIDMYGKCGALYDAHTIFIQLPSRSVVSWGALITAYAQHGHGSSALTLLKEMINEDVEPNKVIYLGSLKACSHAKFAPTGNLVYQAIVKKSLDSDVAIGNSIIDMYAKCRRFEDARKVFDVLSCPTVVSWGVMLAAYVESNRCFTALEFFQSMQEKAIKPNGVIFLCVLKACGRVRALDQGRFIHDCVTNYSMLSIVMCNALIDMYVRCSCMSEAHRVFDQMSNHDSASYDIMMAGYSHHGVPLLALKLLSCMDSEGISPNISTFVHALEVCSSLAQVQIVHCCIAKDGLDIEAVVVASLIHMYKKHGHVLEAFEVFDNLSKPDVIAWGTMIEAYAEHGEGSAALELLEKMKKGGLKPNTPILLSALKICTGIETIKNGRHIHNYILISGTEQDAMLGTSLIHMYMKCGNLVEAYKLFRNLEITDVTSWCTLISGYAQHGYCLFALELFEEMLENKIEPDEGVLLSVMKACANMCAMSDGRLIHSYIICHGFESLISVSSAVTDFYAKSGSMDDASKVFGELPRCKNLPWGPMLAGYVQQGYLISAFELLEKMLKETVELDKIIVLGLLKVFSSVGSIKHGNIIYDVIIINSLETDIVLGNAIVDMYAKCGSINDAMKVFDCLPFKDVVTWGAIIAAFAQHGRYKKIDEYVKQMQTEGSKPTDAIFINILAACSHWGALHEGHISFLSMREEHDIRPDMKHYGSMIDLLSRVGHLENAEDILLSMPSTPDILGWTSLLTSSKTYGCIGMGTHCHEEVSMLNPSNVLSGSANIGNLNPEICSECSIEVNDNEDVIVRGDKPTLESRFAYSRDQGVVFLLYTHVSHACNMSTLFNINYTRKSV